jgi:enamine deaminase RidA (YjgF/YER057c/UK114 family)
MPTARPAGYGPGMPLIRAAGLSDVAEYAYASTVDVPSRLVFTAGACPLDASGATVCPDDYVGQARQVMANLAVALDSAHAKLSDVVKTTVYVASVDRSDLVAVWEVVHDAFGDHEPPSTLLGVTVLGYERQLVEVEAVAAVPAPPDR